MFAIHTELMEAVTVARGRGSAQSMAADLSD